MHFTGGPGGSGVLQAIRKGHYMQTIIDAPERGRYFDIIGFDPRGIGYTTPKLECFPDYLSRQYWVSTSKAEGLLRSSNTSWGVKWARWQSLTQSCAKIAAKTPNSIGYHMNSVPLVKDIIAIIEHHGEWRESVTETYLQNLRERPAGELQLRQTDSDISLREKRKWRRGQESLMYWGVSYGTDIGQLFAALYPDRVSRLLLDAVDDPSGYFHSTFSTGMEQSDIIFEKFFAYCVSSSQCPFRHESESGLRLRFEQLLSSLENSPVIVPATNRLSADIITKSDLLFEIRESVYCPVQSFPYLADILL